MSSADINLSEASSELELAVMGILKDPEQASELDLFSPQGFVARSELARLELLRRDCLWSDSTLIGSLSDNTLRAIEAQALDVDAIRQRAADSVRREMCVAELLEGAPRSASLDVIKQFKVMLNAAFDAGLKAGVESSVKGQLV